MRSTVKTMSPSSTQQRSPAVMQRAMNAALLGFAIGPLQKKFGAAAFLAFVGLGARPPSEFASFDLIGFAPGSGGENGKLRRALGGDVRCGNCHVQAAKYRNQGAVPARSP